MWNLPLRRNEDRVDRGHGGGVEADEPHRGSVEVGNSAANGLDSPAVGIVDVARLPEDDGGNDPRPEELRDHTGPPFPSCALCCEYLCRGTMDSGARNTP